MKKLLIPILAGLLIGLAVSTAAVAFMGSGEPSLSESFAENLAVEGGDSVSDPAVPLAEAITDVAAEADSVGQAVMAHQAMLEVGVTEAPLAATIAGTAGAAMETARLAKLFGSMQPREAARVLEHMDDYEVQVILTQLGNREAAAILGNLTPERAAVISRSVISGERSQQ